MARSSTLGGTQKTLKVKTGVDLTLPATQFTFLKSAGTGFDQMVLTCTANGQMIGVQQQLQVGAGVMYRLPGNTSKLKVDGTTPIVAGDLLASDATGRGVKATGGQWVGAVALEGANAADLIIEAQLIGLTKA